MDAVVDGVWQVRNPHTMFGLDFSGRMTVLRLDGGVLLYSPVPIDDALAASIDAIGPVRWIVAPNRYHHLFAGDAAARWPDAALLVSPGLATKRKDLGGTPLPAEIPGVRMERFGGCAEFDEVVLLHEASGTLLVTDLIMNVHRTAGWVSALLMRIEGVWQRPATPLLWRLLTRDRPAARASASVLLGWPVAHLIPCHGEVVRDEGAAAVRTALAWTGATARLAAA